MRERSSASERPTACRSRSARSPSSWWDTCATTSACSRRSTGSAPCRDAATTHSVSELGPNLALLLVRELQTFERELDLFAEEAAIWTAAPPLSNSAANLALHVAGNLQYFVGTVLGGTGYVRDREREFSRRSGPRADVQA